MRFLVPSTVIALLAALVYLETTIDSPQRCWVVPAMVTVPVWVQGEAHDTPRVCEDTLNESALHGTAHPQCWEMVEKHGEECRK
jgi:hypothetical protein